MIQQRENDGEDSDPLNDAVSKDGAGDANLSFDYRFLRLETIALGDVYERDDRMRAGKVFLETLRDVAGNPHDVSRYFGVLHKMADHPEAAIRSELMDHIPHIAMLCHANKGTLLFALDHLLSLVSKLLTDVDNKVRKSAQVTLLVLMDQALLQQSAVEDVICPVVIQQPTLEDYPGSGVQLMSKMATFLGPESTERLFLKPFCELCQDAVSSVRKRCVLNFGEFCAVVGQRTTEEILLPRFIDLCQDEGWPIRKVCADVLPSVSYVCSIECRKATLAPVFVNLLKDDARPVRTAAFRTLGPFISTFAVPSVADLIYDENGELIFSHPKGTEFRFHTGQERAAFEKQVNTLSIRSQEKPLERFYENLEKQMNTLPISMSMNVVGDLHEDDQKNEDLSFLEKSQDIDLSPVNESEPNLNSSITSVEDALDESCDFNECISDPLPEKEFENNGTELETDSTSSIHQYSDQIVLRNIGTDNISDGVTNEALPQYDSITSKEDHEKQETDLDKENSFHQCSTPGLDPIDEEAPSEIPPGEWDFNSFQYWRVPIPEVDLQTIEQDFMKVNLGSFEDKLTQLCSTLAFHKSDQLSCDKLNYGVSAMRICSNFLSSGTPPQDIVPQELVEHFISMTGPPQYNSEIAQYCAFSLPAVALTLGRENWGFLRGTYEALANDMQWTVRRAVASSIHVLAEILGEDLASKDLVPIFSGLIKDLDEVRIGALRHLGEFLKLLPSSERETFLPKLGEFLVTDNESNWRFREELVQQLLKVLSLFTPEDACTHIKPIAISLLRDKVAAVRNASLLLVTQLVQHVKTESTLLRQLLPQLAEEFAHSLKWERRQAFALLCSHLVSFRVLPGEQFVREVMPHLLDLSYDSVPNVRLAVARTLASDMMGHHFFSGEPHLDVLMQVLRRLSNDIDRDVRYFAAPRFL